MGGGVIKGENWHFQFSPKSYPLSEVTAFLPLNTNPTKWSNTLKQLGKLPTNCLRVFGHFVNLALKGLMHFV